jgi:very-short-patch-repair endonuclease
MTNYVTSVWYKVIEKHIAQNCRQTKSKTEQTEAKNVAVERLNGRCCFRTGDTKKAFPAT